VSVTINWPSTVSWTDDLGTPRPLSQLDYNSFDNIDYNYPPLCGTRWAIGQVPSVSAVFGNGTTAGMQPYVYASFMTTGGAAVAQYTGIVDCQNVSPCSGDACGGWVIGARSRQHYEWQGTCGSGYIWGCRCNGGWVLVQGQTL
jgi:hypothetical protein